MANGRCRMHNGGAAKGLAHPSFRHGRRSRYAVAGKLGEAIDRHLEDPDYLELRDEIAAMTAQIDDALASLADPGAGADLSIVERANLMALAEKRLGQLVEQRRKLVDTETARIKAAHDVLTGEQVRAFAGAVLRAVREEVGDLSVVGRVQERVAMLLSAARSAA